MKLPLGAKNIDSWLAEFDLWITPSLGEIQQSDRFQQELESVVNIFETMSLATQNFQRIEDCHPGAIAVKSPFVVCSSHGLKSVST